MQPHQRARAQVLARMSTDLAILQEAGPECAPARLFFAQAMPLYSIFFCRAAQWLTKLSKERGPGQAGAAAARVALAAACAAFQGHPRAASAHRVAAAAPPGSVPLPPPSVTSALQEAAVAGPLPGIVLTSGGCAVVATLAGGHEVVLEAPKASPVLGAALRELLILDVGIPGMVSLMQPALSQALAADLARVRRFPSVQASESASRADPSPRAVQVRGSGQAHWRGARAWHAGHRA